MVSGSSPLEVWTSGDDYYRYVGRWSRLVAHEFLAWFTVGKHWTLAAASGRSAS